ncbi:MAG: ABC transporter substrate-binding protein [Leptospiraceae bacterium]|nr:ABC transporter substrate-binding protein [Leptospiraceae bacterium]MDW8306036.1 ABC transporter substrate-binding protein [Leptospiraceae bacterium]
MSDYPSRIICLTEESTELFYLLGEEWRIVGISAYTKRPPQAAQQKPKVSSFISANMEKIERLKPELIIGFSDIQAALAHKLIEKGYQVLITNQRSLKEIFEVMQLLSRIVSREEEGKKLIQSWQEKLRQIHEESQILIEKSGGRRVRVFFQEWDEPLISCIEWVGELIFICGGEDIFFSRGRKSASERIVTKEEVASHNPEIWLNSWCGKACDKEWITNEAKWQEVEAIRKNEIYEIESEIILQPGPALFLAGVERIRDIIHRYYKRYLIP